MKKLFQRYFNGNINFDELYFAEIKITIPIFKNKLELAKPTQNKLT